MVILHSLSVGVEQLCAGQSIACHILRVTLPRRDGHVNEAVARDSRYAALIQLARELGRWLRGIHIKDVIA